MMYIGVYPMSNFGGLAIVSIDEATETCLSCFDWGDGPQNIRRTQIYYTSNGRSYIRRYNRRYYFDEIMRAEV